MLLLYNADLPAAGHGELISNELMVILLTLPVPPEEKVNNYTYYTKYRKRTKWKCAI